MRAAMLAGDANALEARLADDCVFTDQNGRRMTKVQDLVTHRSGLLPLAAVDIVGVREVRRWPGSAIVCVINDLVGQYDGQASSGRFAYMRVWRRGEEGWRVAAAYASTATA